MLMQAMSSSSNKPTSAWHLYTPRVGPLGDKHYQLPAPELAEMVRDARNKTLELVGDLDEDELNVPYLEIVNPPRWELCHVAFFYDAFLLQLLGATRPVVEGTDEMFDSFRVAHVDRWSLPLPDRDGTFAYMERVLDRVLDRLGSSQPTPQETYLYSLCALHEDMHGESLTCLRQALGYPVPPGGRESRSRDELAVGPLPGDVEIPGGAYYLGATSEAPFLFDNEKWAHPVELAPFRIARAPVSNAEFLAFVEDGGYSLREWWSYEGWVWRTKFEAEHPEYWSSGDGGWSWRYFDRMPPLEPHAPVIHVNWYEAEAFCNWAGRRLPTEAEWELAACGEPGAAPPGREDRKRRYPWGDGPPTPEHANLDGGAVGCVDVAAFPAGDSAFGCRQMLGNVWEWTSTPFYPYPGYLVDYPYKEYSAPWFGYHKVLRGGAWTTRSRLVNNTYRNFFLPHRTDVFAGFRTCAK